MSPIREFLSPRFPPPRFASRLAIFFVAVSLVGGYPAQGETLPDDLGTRKNGEDWPGFLGPRGDSKSIETGIVTDWSESAPRLVWEMRLGVGYGMPTVSRGRLFLFDRHNDLATVSCYASETAEFLWKYEYETDYRDLYNYNNGPRCSPIVEGDRVYAYGVEGMLVCLAASTGKEIWKIDTAEQYDVIQNFFGVGSTPVIEGNLLIVQVGGSPPENRRLAPGDLGRASGNGSGVVAFDKMTGKEVYKLSNELASYSSPCLATIHGQRWCFLFNRAGLLGFDPNHGVERFFYPWRADLLESVNASNPVVVEDTVFLSEAYSLEHGSCLLKVTPEGVDEVWHDDPKSRKKSMQTHWNTAIHHEGFLYASSGRHQPNAELRCIELQTGKIRWSQPRLTRSSLLYVDGHLVCLTEEGRLLLLRANPDKFDPVGERTLESNETSSGQLLEYPAWAAPILSHGLLYVRGKDRLACLELIPE